MRHQSFWPSCRLTVTGFAAICFTANLLAAQPASALTFADWTTSTTGDLDGTSVTLTGADTPSNFNTDLSSSDYSPAGSASEEAILYFSSTWTATFGAPVSNPLLYARFWRQATYEFDQPFTIQSGFTNNAVVTGNTLDLSASTSSANNGGILAFSGSVNSISILSTSTNGNLATTFAAVPFELDGVLGLGILAGLWGIRAYGKRRHNLQRNAADLELDPLETIDFTHYV